MSMDPQSTSFTPNQDLWRLQSTVRNLSDTQAQHADRLTRLEQRQEEEARLRSVWGSSSPFPGVLGGNLPSDPTTQASNVDFTNFDDDHSANMIRSLHLEPDDEPRRTGAASRANSVRFDESANQGQYGSRNYLDMLSRNSSSFSGLGSGHPLFERASSHKSDGRHSSAGQSISGRANSFANSLGGLDALSPLGPMPSEGPAMAPGLFILGTVPSIIRCWLDTNFTHKALLYAAVCSGSYSSYLDGRLIEQLGLGREVKQDINGTRKIKLQLYLPEATLTATSSRPSSPTSRIPYVSVDFTVADNDDSLSTSKSLQIFLGSDTLRAHNADVLFSTNTLSIFDDEQTKLTVPFVRPEDEDMFRTLRIGNVAPRGGRMSAFSRNVRPLEESAMSQLALNSIARPYTNGTRNSSDSHKDASTSVADTLMGDEAGQAVTSRDSSGSRAVDHSLDERKPVLSHINTTRSEARESVESSTPLTSSSRQATSPAIWSNWRREASSQPSNQGDWVGASKGSSAVSMTRPGRDQGIKVLKPTRQLSRSNASVPIASPVSQSLMPARPFDDRKRPDLMDSSTLKRNVSGDMSKLQNRETSASTGKVNANPVGGASAFGWLNPVGQQK